MQVNWKKLSLLAVIASAQYYTKAMSLSGSKQAITLVTFDVDGTLLGSASKNAESSAHARAFVHAVGKVFGNDEELEKKHTTPLDFIPPEKFHGCTDGLIALNLCKYAYNINVEDAIPKLPLIFETMYSYFSKLSDDEAIKNVEPLEGVIPTLERLSLINATEKKLICGLVTGNVEGLARKKMRASGILQTCFLSRKAPDQTFAGEGDSSFLGGFGTDYCSGDIDDMTRIYKDRGQQIFVAYKRACSLLSEDQVITRILHDGDAPSDVLAAKWLGEERLCGSNVLVGCVGVATGKYSYQDLKAIAGSAIPNKWNPIILEKGLADPSFVDICFQE